MGGRVGSGSVINAVQGGREEDTTSSGNRTSVFRSYSSQSCQYADSDTAVPKVMLSDRFLYLVRIVVPKLEVFMQPRPEAIVIFLLRIIILINIFFVVSCHKTVLPALLLFNQR
jgi:hypothetical protein